MRRAPTFLVALCAALAELVLVAAAGNQWTVDHLVKKQSGNELPRTRELKATVTSFPWRWTPESQQRMLWLGEVVAAVGLVIAVFLLVYALVGPMLAPRSFLSVFVGTWGLVLAITQVAAIGRSLIAYSDLFKGRPGGRDPDGLGRYWYAVFEGPTSFTVWFGAVTGLVVAIVAGILAVTTSRHVAEEDSDLEPALSSEPDEVPDWSAALGSTQMYSGERSWSSTAGEPSRPYTSSGDSTRLLGSDTQSTRAFGAESDSTQAFRPGSSGTGDSTQAIGSSTERTSSLPPPNPADRVSGWPPPESATRPGTSTPSGTSGPGPSGSPTTPGAAPSGAEPPTRAWTRPATPGGNSADDVWSNVTESSAGQIPPVRDEPDENPPTETTLPRAPRPTSELPRPGAIPESGRLPLPEERDSDS